MSNISIDQFVKQIISIIQILVLMTCNIYAKYFILIKVVHHLAFLNELYFNK